jgi:hypothetical protein
VNAPGGQMDSRLIELLDGFGIEQADQLKGLDV